LEFYAGQAVIITLPLSNHFHRVTVLTGFSHTAALYKNVRYLCGAALRQSQGARLLECENHLERSTRFRSFIVRSVASASYVTNYLALPVVITRGRGIGCKLTGKARRRRHRVEDRFGVSSVPTRFAEKGNQDRETYRGGAATARSLGLSRERWRVALRQVLSQCTERRASQAVAATADPAEDLSRSSIKTPAPPSLGSSSSSSLRSEGRVFTSFLSRCPHSPLRIDDPATAMEVLSYLPLSGKYSPFPYKEWLPPSQLRTPSSSNPTSIQSSIPNQNKPADGISQLRGTYCIWI
jgi:hypothetical protein